MRKYFIQLVVLSALLFNFSGVMVSQSYLLSEHDARNTQIFYFNLSKNVVGVDASEFFKPYLAYCDTNGVYRDKMMDAFLFLDLSYNNYGKYYEKEWNNYLNNIFVRTKLPVLYTETNQNGTNSFAVVNNNLAAGLTYTLETNKSGTYSLAFDYKTTNTVETQEDLSRDLIIAVEYYDSFGKKVYPAESDLIYSSGLDMYFKYININEKDTNVWKSISTTFTLYAPFSSVKIKLLNWGLANYYKMAVDNFKINYGAESLISKADEQFNYNVQTTQWEYSSNNRMNYLFNNRNPLIDELNKANSELKSAGVDVGKTKLILEIPDFSYYANGGNAQVTQEIKNKLINYIESMYANYTEWLTKTPDANVEIIGVYHLDENISKTEELFYVDVFQYLRTKLKDYNWQLFASPYNGFYSCTINSSYTDAALSVFDLAWQQPNAFHSGRYGNIDPDMLIKANNLASSKKIAINIENRYIANDEWYGRVNDYFDYGEKFGYINYSKVYYDDAGGHYLHSKSTNKLIRANYDNLYRFIRQADQGQVINGNFETPDVSSINKLHFWTGDYAIRKRVSSLNVNRKFNHLTDTSKEIFSEKIALKTGDDYTISFLAKENYDDKVDFSALMGIRFYDRKHQPVTTPGIVDLPYSGGLMCFYRYFRTTGSYSQFEVKFKAPENAAYFDLFLKKWGEASIEWKSLKMNVNLSVNDPLYIYEHNDSLRFESISKIGSKSLALSENTSAKSTERIPVKQGKLYELTLSAAESLPVTELVDGNKALIGIEMFDINGIKLSTQPPLAGFNFSTALQMNYFYLSNVDQNWREFSRNVQFPDNTFSIKLYIRNWYRKNTILFDNISLSLTENSEFEFDRTNDKQSLLKKTEWTDLFPLTIDYSKSVKYKQFIDVSKFTELHYSSLIKGRDVRYSIGDYLAIEFFDDKYNVINKDESAIDLNYSTEYSYWYKKVFDYSSINCTDYFAQDSDRYAVPNWYTNQWVKDSFDIEIPSKAHYMKLAFVRQGQEGEFKILNPELYPIGWRSDVNTSFNPGFIDDNVANLFYPNPVKDFMYFPPNVDRNLKRMTISSVDGKKYFIKKITSNSVDLSFLPSGSYLMQLSSNTNEKTIRFIKQ